MTYTYEEIRTIHNSLCQSAWAAMKARRHDDWRTFMDALTKVARDMESRPEYEADIERVDALRAAAEY